jgi:hypothetical protein
MDTQQEMVQLLREQNELLKRYLWRLRFSLLGLLLLTTAIAVGLGVYAYRQRSPGVIPTASSYYSPPTGFRSAPVRIVTEERTLPDGKVIYEQRAVEDVLPSQ